jgi:hypothetical protein
MLRRRHAAVRVRAALRFLTLAAASTAVGGLAGCAQQAQAPRSVAAEPSVSVGAATRPTTGESDGGDTLYYVNGAVLHPGTYSLAGGRKIQLRQAVVDAGLPSPVPAAGKVDLICPGGGNAEGVCDTFTLSDVLNTPAGDRELVAGEIVVLRAQ